MKDYLCDAENDDKFRKMFCELRLHLFITSGFFHQVGTGCENFLDPPSLSLSLSFFFVYCNDFCQNIFTKYISLMEGVLDRNLCFATTGLRPKRLLALSSYLNWGMQPHQWITQEIFNCLSFHNEMSKILTWQVTGINKSSDSCELIYHYWIDNKSVSIWISSCVLHFSFSPLWAFKRPSFKVLLGPTTKQEM